MAESKLARPIELWKQQPAIVCPLQYLCIHYANFQLHSDTRSCCRQSIHAFTSRYDSTLLGHTIFTLKVSLLHGIHTYTHTYTHTHQINKDNDTLHAPSSIPVTIIRKATANTRINSIIVELSNWTTSVDTCFHSQYNKACQ